MFKRLFRFLIGKPPTALEVLEHGLNLPPSERDITKLVPVILPLELLELGWPGPIIRIGQLPLAMGWAVLGEANTFFYVTEAEATYWETSGLDWRSVAFDNLAQLARGKPASGEKLDLDGRPFLQALLHEDAIGPSRLLIPGLFEEVFGTEYRVAIPERTCAIVYRSNLTREQTADVDGIINGCFGHGTEPMSAERFDPQAFWNFADGVGVPSRP
jgi:hypothetical protein